MCQCHVQSIRANSNEQCILFVPSCSSDVFAIFHEESGCDVI